MWRATDHDSESLCFWARLLEDRPRTLVRTRSGKNDRAIGWFDSGDNVRDFSNGADEAARTERFVGKQIRRIPAGEDGLRGNEGSDSMT